MKSPLISIIIPSIYKDKAGDILLLPARMAKCTPDTKNAIVSLARSLRKKGGWLILSDLFRSYEMQLTAHNDYISGRKKAFSPAPGTSFHEAGRAFDLDLSEINISLKEFWKLAAKVGVYPIIKEPNSKLSEAWHFDCRGSHQLVYDYYAVRGTAMNFSPYTAAAASAILSIGVKVDSFKDQQDEAAIQSGLIRLGKDIGNIDGKIGRRTKAALKELGLKYDVAGKKEILLAVEDLLQQKFPGEYI